MGSLFSSPPVLPPRDGCQPLVCAKRNVARSNATDKDLPSLFVYFCPPAHQSPLPRLNLHCDRLPALKQQDNHTEQQQQHDLLSLVASHHPSRRQERYPLSLLQLRLQRLLVLFFCVCCPLFCDPLPIPVHRRGLHIIPFDYEQHRNLNGEGEKYRTSDNTSNIHSSTTFTQRVFPFVSCEPPPDYTTIFENRSRRTRALPDPEFPFEH